jgi:hypothetical protein
MKRADDLREFMKDRVSVAESIEFFPDVPDVSISYISRVNAECPIVDDPYERSGIADSGMAIWDSVFLAMPKSVSLVPKRPKDLSPLRSINAEWEKTKEALGMVGKPDGVHYLRPKGRYILDMMNDDIRMLQGAHILAHRYQMSDRSDEYTFGQLSDAFLNCLVKLFIARLYGLKVNVRPGSGAVDSFSLYGIDVAVSTDLRSPVMVEPIGSAGMVLNETVAVVLGSVGIEAHPAHAAKDGHATWKEVNKWSCLPTLVALAGWECVDYIAHAERTEVRGELHCAVPCGDLQPMSDFGKLLEAARSARGEVGSGPCTMLVEEWLGSDDFLKGLSVTPQLPCPCCIRVNDKAEGVVRRPRSRKPKMSLRDAEQSGIPEIKEWVDYVHFMNRCIEVGRQATTYALKSVTSAARRNAAFKKRAALMRRAEVLRRKYRRKMESGFISEAEAINAKIEEIEKELRE